MQPSDFPVPVKRSLRVILEDLDEADALGILPSDLMVELRNKVDGTIFVIEKWEDQIDQIQREWQSLLDKKIAKLRHQIARRKEYVHKQMMLRDITCLNGNIRKISLRKNPKKTVYLEPASAEAWEKYPGFVKVEPAYVWDKDNVANALAGGRELEFAKQTQGTSISYRERGTKKKDT